MTQIYTYENWKEWRKIVDLSKISMIAKVMPVSLIKWNR